MRRFLGIRQLYMNLKLKIDGINYKTEPTQSTPELKDDPKFKLEIKEIWLRLRGMIERSKNSEETKKEMLDELDNAFYKVAEKLNLV